MKVEGYHFDSRKHLLDYDDVLNTQRETIYSDRHDILDGENLKDKIIGLLRQEFQDLINRHLPGRHSDDWDASSFLGELELICALPPDLADEDSVYQLNQNQVAELLSDYADTAYDNRETEIGSEQMRTVERLLLLRAIDTHWVNHLTGMENLRTGIGLHAYGQRDPLIMYRAEGQKMFKDLLSRMQHDVAHSLFHLNITQQPVNVRGKEVAAKASPMAAVAPGRRDAVPAGGGKIGRNAQCPCGSGKKYKRCHGAGV